MAKSSINAKSTLKTANEKMRFSLYNGKKVSYSNDLKFFVRILNEVRAQWDLIRASATPGSMIKFYRSAVHKLIMTS